MPLSKKDTDILRSLAAAYMDIAMLDTHKEKIELWKALNRMKMQRPMVNIDQVPWVELNTDGCLDCQITDPYWKNIEFKLRTTIRQWGLFPCDMVVEPFIQIPKVINFSGYGIGPKVERIEQYEGTNAPAQGYENIIRSMDDIAGITDIEVSEDKTSSGLRMAEAKTYFDGIAPVVFGNTFEGEYGMHLGIWDLITMLMGIENAYLGMLDEPDLIHALLNRLTESTIAGIIKANELGLHDDNRNICHCSYVYTDELLPGPGLGRGPVSSNCWAFGLAQLFTGVSPQLMGEFEFPYITRMAEYFGMIYYGCCDRLDDRLDMVRKIPNIRKVSCSPWSNRENFAANIGQDLVMSNKPSPAYLAEENVDWDAVRSDMRRTVDLAKNNSVNLELILKDVSTIRFQPERLAVWSRIAMEEVCR